MTGSDRPYLTDRDRLFARGAARRRNPIGGIVRICSARGSNSAVEILTCVVNCHIRAEATCGNDGAQREVPHAPVRRKGGEWTVISF
jgi:hypothetical protein